MLVCPRLKPVGPAPSELTRLGHFAGLGIPIGALPAADIAEVSPALFE
ncbi:unannotated protein [freshwater metagenome]|uniref:Unannotated protein n=1 Tax=freshwater metagenome TaxID=449393 RepID=A0A6J7RMZ2_9ZZZZ